MGVALLEDEHTLNGILDHLHKQHVPRYINPIAYDVGHGWRARMRVYARVYVCATRTARVY